MFLLLFFISLLCNYKTYAIRNNKTRESDFFVHTVNIIQIKMKKKKEKKHEFEY